MTFKIMQQPRLVEPCQGQQVRGVIRTALPTTHRQDVIANVRSFLFTNVLGNFQKVRLRRVQCRPAGGQNFN